MKNCINCGAEISDDAKFCGKCGEKQERPTKHCIHCGAEIPADFVYCEVCGTKQNTNDQPAPMTAKVPEPPVMSAQVVHEPSLRQKLMPYIVFTIIVQLAIIALMLLDFMNITISGSVRILGHTIDSEGQYFVNVFDLFHFTDTLNKFIPNISIPDISGMDFTIITNYFFTGFVLLISLLFAILYSIVFSVKMMINKPVKFSWISIITSAFFPIKTLFLANKFESEIVNMYMWYGTPILKPFSDVLTSQITWTPILIMVLTLMQLFANLIVRINKENGISKSFENFIYIGLILLLIFNLLDIGIGVMILLFVMVPIIICLGCMEIVRLIRKNTAR